jgi:predicted Fe-Mo cluster-binding NifX family protein
VIVALPVVEGKLALHFGHCERFAFVEVDEDGKSIVKTDYIDSPPHQPGLLPEWLREKGASVIVAGGMGRRAQAIFSSNNIEVVVGAPSDTPEHIVQAYMDGKLRAGENLCDH